MNRLLLVFAIAIAVAVASCSPPQAAANPTAYYNPATGGIWIKNDGGSRLLAVVIYSETLLNVAKNDPSLYATIPDALFDPGDLPLGFIYTNFPTTGSGPFGIYIGDVIVPGTPTSALTGAWQGQLEHIGERFPIIEIPEPSAVAMAACSLLLLVRRRWASQIEAN